MFRAFNLSSKYGRSKAEKILLTYQTFAISVKVPTPYTTQPPCHNCVAILGETVSSKFVYVQTWITVKTLNIGTPRPATVVVLNIKQFYFTMK